MGVPRLEECSQVLIVEGQSDLYFYAEILEDLGVTGVFIKAMGGRSNITTKAGLEAFLRPSLLERTTHIAIIIDADANGEGAANRLSQLLKEITTQTLAESVWSEGRPRLGFLIIPDALPVDPTTSTHHREIETVVWEVWSKAQPQGSAEVDRYLAAMKDIDPSWTPKSLDKGRLGAFFPLVYDDDPRLGPVIRTRRSGIDLAAPGFARLRNFLLGFTTSTHEVTRTP
jgi:5S rRNA maturation endonuclease (ribonuclease M5)